MVIIVIAGLVILGPERLPGAMSWLARTVKQVRSYATGAQTQLRDELGPEFEDLRKPLSELQQLRGMTPRAAITKHLLDGDDSLFTGEFNADDGGAGTTRNGAAAAGAGAGAGDGAPPSHGVNGGAVNGGAVNGGAVNGGGTNGASGAAEVDGAGRSAPRSDTRGETPPAAPGGPAAYDVDAT